MTGSRKAGGTEKPVALIHDGSYAQVFVCINPPVAGMNQYIAVRTIRNASLQAMRIPANVNTNSGKSSRSVNHSTGITVCVCPEYALFLGNFKLSLGAGPCEVVALS